MTANKGRKPYTVVSYFCGCGGLDLGFCGGFSYHHVEYERLPFKILKAYDKEERCIETYNDYFCEANAFAQDITQLDPADVPSADVLIGGFPCQEFSSCGPLRGLDSERGRLYETLIDYMSVHKPMVVVGENVINLKRMDNGKVLEKIESDLARAGYRVKVWEMFAPDYGIPQRRTRLIIVCVRKDLAIEYGMPREPVPLFEGNYRSIEWAIGDLETITENSVVPNQGDYFAASRAKKGNGQGDEVNQRDKPAYTIRANSKSRIQFHYSLKRRLTVRECARIQTFPDDFKFKFSKTVNMSQIGNAVPPILAYQVANSIEEYLDAIPKKEGLDFGCNIIPRHNAHTKGTQNAGRNTVSDVAMYC